MPLSRRPRPMTDIRPPNGVHPTDLTLLKRLMFFYGRQLALRALAAICDDYAVQCAATNASEAKHLLTVSTLLEQIADSIEEQESKQQ